MKLVSIPRPLVFHVLRVAIPFFLLICFYVSLSVSKYHSFLFSTYEFIMVAKSNREFVLFMFTVVSVTINIVFGILRPPRKDADHYIWLDEVKDYTVLKVSDEDYYNYDKCSDCGEDNNECGSDGYDEVKDYTVLKVSDEDYYNYDKCSDCGEDNNECGSDGYDEDNDDSDSGEDLNSEEFYGEEIDSEELKRRAEDFIAKQTRKWREEFVFENKLEAAIKFQSSN